MGERGTTYFLRMRIWINRTREDMTIELEVEDGDPAG